MASGARVSQKEKLYSLLLVKKAYEKAGIEILPELKNVIQYAKIVMRAEDIAHVEKQVEQE